MNNPDDPTLPYDSAASGGQADPVPPPHTPPPGVVFPPPPPREKKGGGCLKGCLIAFAAVLVLVFLIGVAGSFWWNKSGKAMAAAADSAKVQGKSAGAAMDEDGCVTAALARTGTGVSVGGLLKDKGFLEGCLRTSRPTPNLCQGVPAVTEIRASANWSPAACAARGSKAPTCPSLMQTVQQYCALGKPKEGANVTGDTTGAAASTTPPAAETARPAGPTDREDGDGSR